MATISFIRDLKVENPDAVKRLVDDLVFGGKPLVIPEESLRRLKEEEERARKNKSKLAEALKKLK
jgi:hypothetical protein